MRANAIDSPREAPAIKRDAFQGGANDYLVKLPDKIELVARIRLHSKAFVTQIQRDDAYRSLTESERQLVLSNSQLEERIHELQAVRDELARLVSTDSMTGLYSRRRWLELAATEFTRHRRYKRPLTLLMADLDLFKRINDTHGHDIGDEVIRQFAGVLRELGRESDLPGRIGGEEFAVLLPETPMTGGEEVARRVVAACCLFVTSRHNTSQSAQSVETRGQATLRAGTRLRGAWRIIVRTARDGPPPLPPGR